ncbi:MAG TPA: hypothetical protein VLV78_01415 [Thermoanaerobaculia bacterium]|nr:hypothetical protein [Thermoanaerobaculia bacterium]
MSAKSIEETRWTDVPIVCPECGNHGEPNGTWTHNSWAPFRLIEEVVRSFMFSAEVDEKGKLELIADTETDAVDWESSSNLRFECMACFAQFAIPDEVSVDFQ